MQALSRIAAILTLGILGGGAGVASMIQPDLASLTLPDYGHRALLRAKITTTDGMTRTVTLKGVGCAESICSRVAMRNVKTDSIWLDGLASVRRISRDSAAGPVKVVFKFRNGTEREESVSPWSRVLYIRRRLGSTEKLDLAGLNEIDFVESE